MVKIKVLLFTAAFLLVSPFITSASGSGNSYGDTGSSNSFYEDNNRSYDRGDNRDGYFYGSNIPGPELFVDRLNTIPWFNPPYEPYEYKFHSFPNGDFYFSTPGNNYLPYISSGNQIQPFNYGAFMNDYYGR